MSKKSRKVRVEEVVENNQDIKEITATEEVKTEESVILENNLIQEVIIQLNIYENRVIDIIPEAKRVVVENIGGGDVYIDVTAIQFNVKTMLSPNNTREFKGVDKLYISSASRPSVKISFYKK